MERIVLNDDAVWAMPGIYLKVKLLPLPPQHRQAVARFLGA